jgi:hypothetical protein
MAYKRYIKKKGKVFGPYYYESYRDNSGKVKRRYLGTVDPNKKTVLKKNCISKNKYLIKINTRDY